MIEDWGFSLIISLPDEVCLLLSLKQHIRPRYLHPSLLFFSSGRYPSLLLCHHTSTTLLLDTSLSPRDGNDLQTSDEWRLNWGSELRVFKDGVMDRSLDCSPCEGIFGTQYLTL